MILKILIMKKNKVLVAGAGGFIGGHLVAKLRKLGYEVVAADIKPIKNWFQHFEDIKNYSLDLKNLNDCLSVTEGCNYVFNMACNMGGMGFIENNKAECMLSVLINTNLLISAKKYSIEKYFFSSSACVYNQEFQNKSFISGLKEKDAYPAMPEDGYGWEKLFSERMCRHFKEDFNLNVSIARYHNVYGPLGTYDGGREKAPAAICRKILQIENKENSNNELEIWGDGEQTRSFLYIDDCIEGTLKLFFESNFSEPLNIGSEEQVSINQMVDIISKISNTIKFKKKYLNNMPKGVRGRSSNNELLKKTLNWNYKISLSEGLTHLYNWMKEDMKNNKNVTNKFTIKY